MLSLSHPPKPPSFFPNHQNPRLTTENRSRLRRQQQQQQQQQRRLLVSVSAAKLPFSPPPSSPPGEVYQPFRPPPSSPLPARFRSLSVTERLDVLRLRLGLWHEYAPLISALSRDGFTPASIEDATGIPGAEQNRLIVAAQVRDSLLASAAAFPADLLAFFDAGGGAEVLYELRLLSAAQRAAAAARVAERRLDPRGARDLARSVKDFPRRRADDGWRAFSPDSPADCLAFALFRQSREALDPADRLAALSRALDTADTDSARTRIAEEIERATRRGDDSKEEEEEAEAERRAAVPVLRLRYGEVAEAAAVVLLPAVRAAEGAAGVAAAPARLRAQGELGVVAAEAAWGRWAVLPGWAPVMEASETAVAVEMEDGRALPWRSMAAAEEAVLVVAERGRRKVEQEGGAYVVDREGRLVVERGKRLMETGVAEALATVVLVVRPPREDDDQLSEEDWD